MPEPLKNMFNRNSLHEIAVSIHSVYDQFRIEGFLESVMDGTWDDLELMARCRKISVTLGEYLPEDYAEALSILENALENNPVAFFFPDFVEVHGQNDNDWDTSISALERNTCRWSSEFAVRPFIVKDEERMMAQMRKWSESENEHIRRLASEGCRPQLPWSFALTGFKDDPSPIIPILERLKTDPSPYVRKSVANNLNDISKSNPNIVTDIAKDWYGKDERTDWILKHGCRTLLKKGDREMLALFGYENTAEVDVSDFRLDSEIVQSGGDLTFSFSVMVKEDMRIRLEYAIDYVKSNGRRSRKIFRISETSLAGDKRKHYRKKHSFADLSTRKHYPGVHCVTLIVNGTERGRSDFELLP